MRIPNQARVEEGESPEGWVARLNKFFLQTVSALESVKSADRYVDVNATGTGINSTVTVALSRNASPVKAVMLVKVTDADRPIEPVILQQPFWTQSGSTISATVAGLPAGKTYRLRFLLKQEL
jgi:hypothetical protein